MKGSQNTTAGRVADRSAPSLSTIDSPNGFPDDAVVDVNEKELTTEGHSAPVRGGADGSRASLAQIVRGVETYFNHGTRNVQRGLQNLQLCGVDDLVRIAPAIVDGEGLDLLAPISLRHTHSSPQQYSSAMVEDEELPPSVELDPMRRSSSTPSTSAFRQLSGRSAFRTHMRSFSRATGRDDRSAFSLPMQRSSSYASQSDSGVRHSAFNPVSAHPSSNEMEKTSIEVVDFGPTAEKKAEPPEKKKMNIRLGAAARARKFLADVKVRRRRRRRGGRENPARPPSTSSVSSRGDDERGSKQAQDQSSTDSGIQDSANGTPGSAELLSAVGGLSETLQHRFPPVHESSADRQSSSDKLNLHGSNQYQQLDSDVDEEYRHYQRIETTITSGSPSSIPSPSFQQFVDHTETIEGRTNESTVPPVRIQVSAAPSPSLIGRDSMETPLPIRDVVESDDSPGTALSTATNNTSGHTTQATATSTTSATVSSGRITVLSVVTETDREVMETNQAGKIRRLEHLQRGRSKQEGTDGSVSIHSSSTGSTATHGYLALAGSPAPLREGASLPMDRFFTQSRLSTANSQSVTTGSSSSGSHDDHPQHRMDSQSLPGGTKKVSLGSPVSSSAGQTISIRSGGEEPPRFVSYLDRQMSTNSARYSTQLSHTSSITSRQLSTRTDRVDVDDRESPARIVGYPQVIFEEANPETECPRVIRPSQQRERSSTRSRPPLSPNKGFRTPPPYSRPDSVSPGVPQQSPPNIVEKTNHLGLSKPYVLRTVPHRAIGGAHKMVLSTPDIHPRGSPTGRPWEMDGLAAFRGDVLYPYEGEAEVPLDSPELFETLSPRTYHESSIEVDQSESSLRMRPIPIVTPEKEPERE